jgi:hypothetical protein
MLAILVPSIASNVNCLFVAQEEGKTRYDKTL